MFTGDSTISFGRVLRVGADTDLVAGAGNGDPQELVSWNGLALFSAIGPGGARRVFRSDGTIAGTFEVAPSAPYGPCTRMVAAGNQVFFGTRRTPASTAMPMAWACSGTGQ